MADLSLDLNPLSPTYGDLLVINGDLVLTSDANPSGANPVLQDILIRLRTFAGEWFNDNTLGVPWFQNILVKNPDVSLVNSILKNEILSTPGVLHLDSFTSKVSMAPRKLTVAFSCTSQTGTISYSGQLTNNAGSI